VKPGPPLPKEFPPDVLERARAVDVWEADVVAVPAIISGEDRSRTVAALVVAEGVALEADMRLERSAEPEDVARALEEALSRAAAAVGVWPARVMVRHDEVARVLEPLLRHRGCGVRTAPVLRDLDALARDLAAHLSGQEGWPAVSAPDSWAGWGLPHSIVENLFQAYAAYYRAAPWRWLGHVPPILAEWDDGTKPWVASVMGAALGEFGLAVYSHPDDFEDLLEPDEDHPPFLALRGWVVHLGYHHRRELPRAMLKEVSRAGWEVEAVAAYPYILPILTPGGGLQQELVRRLAQLLDGVASLVGKYGERLGSPEGGVFTWTKGELTLHYAVAPEVDPVRGGMPPGVQDIMDEVRQGRLETQEEIEAHLARRMEDYNTAPQEELGGISPEQARTLLEGGVRGEGPLRFAEDLSLDEIEGSAFLANARAFLNALLETGGTLATAAGNLKRAFVAEMLEGMRLRDGYLEDLHRMNRVVNEEDAWPLHILRVNLEVAGLIRRRKGRFHPTKKGREMAKPEAAGRLFVHLFRTYFGKFNLEYGRLSLDQPSLQPAVPLLLWQLGVHAQDWVTVGDLARQILPGRPEDHPGDAATLFPDGAALLNGTVLTPLEGFGLLEERVPGGIRRWRRGSEDTQIRATPLFEGFLHFDWD